MTRNMNFEIVDVSDEYIAVPIGEEAISFHGVVVLSEPAAYLLKHMSERSSTTDLVNLLVNEYDITRSTAEQDVNEIIQKFKVLNLILDD